MAENYYGFSFGTNGTATNTAFYYITLHSQGAIDGFGITIYPSAANTTYVNTRATSVQWQSPAARLSGGLTIVTGAANINGVIGVSPAINVPFTMTGPAGSVTVPAGQTEVPFNFTVSASEALSGGGADFLAKEAPKPDAE
jgi:hypothetical protein